MEQADAAALEKDIGVRRFLIIACEDDRRLTIEECDFVDYELEGIAAWLRLFAERALMESIDEDEDDEASG